MTISEIKVPKREFTRAELDGPKGPTGYPESFNGKTTIEKSSQLKPQKQKRL